MHFCCHNINKFQNEMTMISTLVRPDKKKNKNKKSLVVRSIYSPVVLGAMTLSLTRRRVSTAPIRTFPRVVASHVKRALAGRILRLGKLGQALHARLLLGLAAHLGSGTMLSCCLFLSFAGLMVSANAHLLCLFLVGAHQKTKSNFEYYSKIRTLTSFN